MELNTKTVYGEYKLNFYRTRIYNGIESKTLSIVEYWNTGKITYIRVPLKK
jgi:hypothetical protein